MSNEITDAELRRIERADEERAAADEQRRADRAAAKRMARVFTDADRPADLAAAGVPQQFHPTKERYNKFWRFIWPRLGTDPEGWWYGRCLLHDVFEAAPAVASAMYNFNKGVMRCMGDPCCHIGKGSMSLTNAYASWLAANLTVEDAPDAEAR